ncbi:hypothetical protein SB773_31505, partial [Bacillus sp. SIMBA_074]
EETAGAYRDFLRQALEMPIIPRYFTPMAVQRASGRRILSDDTWRLIDQVTKASRKRTSDRVGRKILETNEDGTLRFVERPPVLTRAEPEIQ